MANTRADLGLTLRTFGPLKIEDSGGSEIPGLSRRAQALLAYLSQQPEMRAERGFLADLLWSDRSEEQARASLRQELSVLRKKIDPQILDADRQFVRLDPALVTVDGKGRGEFLQGFDLGSEGFEDWLREQRSAAPDEASSKAEPAEASVFFSRPTVLLMSFEALSSGSDDAMISAGLADDLRTTLSYWRWFPVIGPEAIGWKTAREVDLRAVAAEVGAAYAITGTVRCLGQRIKISVGLTDTATSQLIWTQQFEGTLEDIFSFQEEVSRSIVAQIEPQISRAEVSRLSRARPKTIEPWQLVAQADEIERKSAEGYGTWESNTEELKLAEEALRIEPDFSLGYSRLGRIFFRAGLLDWVEDRNDAFEKSLEYCNRALQCDPDNWEAHAYHGLVNIFGFRKYDLGVISGAEAVRRNPSAALARHAAGCGLEWLGKPSEALEHLNLVFRLDPAYSGRAAALGDIATCEMFIGNRENSLEAARRLHAIAPDYARGLQRCVSTFGYFDELDLAHKALARLREIQPGFDEAYVRETYPYYRPEDLEKLLTGFRKAGAF